MYRAAAGDRQIRAGGTEGLDGDRGTSLPSTQVEAAPVSGGSGGGGAFNYARLMGGKYLKTSGTNAEANASEADILTLIVKERKGNSVFDELYNHLKLATQKNGVIFKSDTIAKSTVK